MSGNSKTLVVGTTPDYIQWIRNSRPGRALFLTDTSLRKQAREPVPDPAEEILVNLKDRKEVQRALARHLEKEAIHLDGLACFDCEAMPLAALLGKALNLAYASPEAIAVCQDKFQSKQIWRENDLPTPLAELTEDEEEVVEFFRKTGKPCVLKPRNGTGSEFIFLCRTEDQCRNQYRKMLQGLALKKDHPLYGSLLTQQDRITVESFLEGEEFSCDFLLEEDKVRILRVCKKWVSHDPYPGTAMGYILFSCMQAPMDMEILEDTLLRGSKALGLTRALCMADFILAGKGPALLEMAPRPGGDCIPFLLKKAWNLDIQGLNLDYAAGERVEWSPSNEVFAGLRLHANREGVLKGVSVNEVAQDPRVLEIHLTKNPGHRISMPPEDYDSRLLGHVIFKPDKDRDVIKQFIEIKNKIGIHLQ